MTKSMELWQDNVRDIEQFITREGVLMRWCKITNSFIPIITPALSPNSLVDQYAITTAGIPTNLRSGTCLIRARNHYKLIYPFGKDTLISMCESGNVNIINIPMRRVDRRVMRGALLITISPIDGSCIIATSHNIWKVITIDDERINISAPRLISNRIRVIHGVIFQPDNINIYNGRQFQAVKIPRDRVIDVAPLMTVSGLKCYMITDSGCVHIYDVSTDVTHNTHLLNMMENLWSRFKTIDGKLLIIDELERSYIIDSNEFIIDSKIPIGMI